MPLPLHVPILPHRAENCRFLLGLEDLPGLSALCCEPVLGEGVTVMRRHSLMLLAAAAIGLAASQASAADLQVRKAPAYVPPPPVTWTGCYIGANIITARPNNLRKRKASVGALV